MSSSLGGTSSTTSSAGKSEIGGDASSPEASSPSGGSAPVYATPTVQSFAPLDGKTGSPADTQVVVQFSEPMDRLSVSKALSISGVESSRLTLTWNDESSRLTIKANDGFEYAEGSTIDIAAKKFVVSISTLARGTNGKNLDETHSSSFFTLRRITQTVKASGVYPANTYIIRDLQGQPDWCDKNFTEVGFFVSGYGITAKDNEKQIYTTFNTEVMAPSPIVEAATFQAVQGPESGNGAFYSSNGKVYLAKMVYQSVNNTILNAAVDNQEGVLSSSVSDVEPALNVTTYFKSDVEAGRKNLLYRLSAYTTDAKSSYAQFSCTDFAIQTTYLAP